MSKVVVVTTTINLPIFISSYIKNFTEHDIPEYDVEIIIIGDLNSNPLIEKYCNSLNSNYSVSYISPLQQKKWINRRFPKKDFDLMIPWCSIRRRNMGYLLSIEKGADIIVTIDDDNYPSTHNFVGDHSLTYNKQLCAKSLTNNFVNPCDFLDYEPDNLRLFSRGYPLSKMLTKKEYEFNKDYRKPVLNLGLWYENPDVDAISNMLAKFKSKGLRGSSMNQYSVANDQFIPIDTQNTSFSAEIVVPSYCLLQDTNVFGELKIDRYDDVWWGYFVKKLTEKLGHAITFGRPLTIHRRRQYDVIKDFKAEWIGMLLNDTIVEILEEIEIKSCNYVDGYFELAEKLNTQIKRRIKLESIVHYFDRLMKAQQMWIEVCEELT